MELRTCLCLVVTWVVLHAAPQSAALLLLAERAFAQVLAAATAVDDISVSRAC